MFYERHLHPTSLVVATDGFAPSNCRSLCSVSRGNAPWVWLLPYVALLCPSVPGCQSRSMSPLLVVRRTAITTSGLEGLRSGLPKTHPTSYAYPLSTALRSIRSFTRRGWFACPRRIGGRSGGRTHIKRVSRHYRFPRCEALPLSYSPRPPRLSGVSSLVLRERQRRDSNPRLTANCAEALPTELR